MTLVLKIIAYYRVSTDQQGQSGLGLDAQRSMVEAYARSVGGEIVLMDPKPQDAANGQA